MTYRHNRSLSEVASQIEEGVNISQDRKVSVLVASWILVRGKGGGFGKRMYSSVARDALRELLITKNCTT